MSATTATAQQLHKQVVYLSLTNRRDALHHGKLENFKTVT